MLRPLEHEVPPQVRKADQSWSLRIRRRGLGFKLDWHPDARQHFPFNLRVVDYPTAERAERDFGSFGLIEVNGNSSIVRRTIRRLARLTG
jgi:hypothetical protein